MDEEKVREETIEPQIHIITAASKDSVTLVHQLPWREGAQCEYTVLMDGKPYQIPQGIFKGARSSWKVNKKAEWTHRFDERGLCCEQQLVMKDKPHVLRYWRSLESPNEIKVNVHLYEVAETGEEKEVVHPILPAPALQGEVDCRGRAVLLRHGRGGEPADVHRVDAQGPGCGR